MITFSNLLSILMYSSERSSLLLPHLIVPSHPLPTGFLSDLVLHCHSQSSAQENTLHTVNVSLTPLSSLFSLLFPCLFLSHSLPLPKVFHNLFHGLRQLAGMSKPLCGYICDVYFALSMLCDVKTDENFRPLCAMVGVACYHVNIHVHSYVQNIRINSTRFLSH